jgi:hypothetical protein
MPLTGVVFCFYFGMLLVINYWIKRNLSSLCLISKKMNVIIFETYTISPYPMYMTLSTVGLYFFFIILIAFSFSSAL